MEPVTVEKKVERLYTTYVDKQVEVEKVVEVPVYVENKVEVPVERVVDRYVDKLVNREVEIPVEKYVDKIIEVEQVVEKPKYVDRIVEREVERQVMNSDVNVKMNEDNQHLLFEIQTQMQRKVELQNNLAVLNQQHRAAEGMSSRNLMLENEWNTLHQRLLLLQQEWHN